MNNDRINIKNEITRLDDESIKVISNPEPSPLDVFRKELNKSRNDLSKCKGEIEDFISKLNHDSDVDNNIYIKRDEVSKTLSKMLKRLEE